MKKLGLLVWILLPAVPVFGQDGSPAGETGHPARTRTGIILAGSSITWGAGNLQDRFSGYVVDYMMNTLATTRMCDSMEYNGKPVPFLNPKQYRGRGLMIKGRHARVAFDLYGDEIAVCQSILRTKDYAVMQVKADGKVIGTFANHNPTLGAAEQTFSGTGERVKFMLDHPYTYDHLVTVDGKEMKGEIYHGGWNGEMPEGVDYLVIRKFDPQKKPVHALWFREAPSRGAVIKVRYKYGKVIMFEGSTTGQLARDDQNESNYGEGKVPFDLTRPARLKSGMDYRYIDRHAFWIHKFTARKKRHYEIEIIGGVNPYFIINFASNRYHDMMNAGIGGWSLSLYLDEDGVHDYEAMFRKFLPDVLVMEAATNDDWQFGERKLKRIVTGLSEQQVKDLWTLEVDSIAWQKETGDYTVRFCTGLISGIDAFSLTSPQITGSTVKAGDIIRIGTYHGDNRQVVCREIYAADTVAGRVSWLQPLDVGEILNIDSLKDLIGQECSVRDLSGYEKQYRDLIDKVRIISPHTRILITQPGWSNYRERQLWGYQIIHRKLANEYVNTGTIEVTDRLRDFQVNYISGRKSLEIPADGSKTYLLPWSGHWQGFEVWVDQKDVYGKDCYIEQGKGYSVPQDRSGEALNISGAYDKSHDVTKKMKLVFTQNIPQTGMIRVIKADTVWAHDFTHTNEAGAYIYGRIYVDRIRDLLH